MNTVGFPHLWIPNLGLKILISMHSWLNAQNPEIQRANCVFIEENPHVSGPMQSNLCFSRVNCILKAFPTSKYFQMNEFLSKLALSK